MKEFELRLATSFLFSLHAFRDLHVESEMLIYFGAKIANLAAGDFGSFRWFFRRCNRRKAMGHHSFCHMINNST